MIWLTLSAALAQSECPDLADRLAAAWAAFDDAEVAETDRVLAEALRDLPCQARVLGPDELRQLFLLDATASLATADETGAVYAAIRAVVLDPDAPVDTRYGPGVAELVATWSRRLGSNRLEIENRSATALFVDGREVAPGATFVGIEGEHVLQWDLGAGTQTTVRELVGRAGVDVALRDLLVPATAPMPAPTPAPAPQPIADRPSPAVPPAPPVRRRSAPAVWGTGLALAAIGGGAVIAGWQVQERFEANPYDADSYDGCARADACWTEARADAIRRDATLIRALYGGGYGLIGVGAVLFGVGFAIHPDGGAVSVQVPF